MGVPFPWAGARKLQSLAAWLARHSQHVRKLSFSIRVADDDEMSVWGPAAACIDAVAATGQLEELNLDSMPVSTDSFALAALSSLLRRLSLARSVGLTPAISALTALESLILTGDTDCPADVRLPSSITRLIVERDGDGDVTERASLAALSTAVLWMAGGHMHVPACLRHSYMSAQVHFKPPRHAES